MPGQVRGREILPARNDNKKGDFGYHPAAAISKWEILQVTNVVGGTVVADLADASAATTASGALFIAVHEAEPQADRPNDPVARMNPGPYLVGPVDTSAATAFGHEVYLSDTPGAVSFGVQGTTERVVGHTVVDDATNGYWLFFGYGNRDYAI